MTATGTGNGEMPPSCDAPPPASPLIGWATVPGMGNGTVSVDTTTGGDMATPISVTTLADLNNALAGIEPAVVQIVGTTIAGNVRIGSNKTLVGICGGAVQGSIKISRLVQRHRPQPQDRRLQLHGPGRGQLQGLLGAAPTR